MVSRTTTAKKTTAKKTTAKKTTAQKSTAKKATAKKAPAKKATAKKATARRRRTPVSAEQLVKGVKGTIRFFDPATGRGVIEEEGSEREITLDVSKARILNKGYVRLEPGRPVTVSVMQDAATEVSAN